MTRSTLFALATAGLVSAHARAVNPRARPTRRQPALRRRRHALAVSTSPAPARPSRIRSTRKWFSDYAAKTGVKINYQSIGSGGGIRQLTEETVDFGASDAPMTDEELAKARAARAAHPDGARRRRRHLQRPRPRRSRSSSSGDVIADIFLGKITKWNDAGIAALNPGVKLPASDILVVHRSDGSGTTYIFTDYLTAVSPAWAAGPARARS